MRRAARKKTLRVTQARGYFPQSLKSPLCLLLLALLFASPLRADEAPRRNIVFILADDHRWDWLGFLPEAPDFLETPHLDRLAREGAYLRHAFVSTSLCSPSRASILTGNYMHRHRVVDNQGPEPASLRFFGMSSSIAKV